MNILAVIPARGGSKSVPRKNIRNLMGKPLIAWVIEETKKSNYLTRSIVSTDDEEIAEVARSYGAEVPFLRPREISHDLATDVEFLIHALDWIRANEGNDPDIVLRLPPTSPLTTAAHIDEGIQKLLETPEADAVRPVVEASKHPYKMWQISPDGQWLMPFLPTDITGFETPHNLPRQLFPKVYTHTGAMDVIWVRRLRKLKSTSGNRLAYFLMKPEESINIDEEVDFEIAQLFMTKRLARRADPGRIQA